MFQSRSGRPEDPWLGPDVCDYLRGAAGTVPGVVLVPIGFVCDHIEVLYDLDHEAAEVCRGVGLPMVRAETVNDDPLFLDMETEVVIESPQHLSIRVGRCRSFAAPHETPSRRPRQDAATATCTT